jgi:hypothetical protein
MDDDEYDPRKDPNHPKYEDPRENLNDPNYDPKFDPRADMNNPKYDPKRDPISPEYDKRLDPRLNPRNVKYDPRRNPDSSLYQERLDPLEDDTYQPELEFGVFGRKNIFLPIFPPVLKINNVGVMRDYLKLICEMMDQFLEDVADTESGIPEPGQEKYVTVPATPDPENPHINLASKSVGTYRYGFPDSLRLEDSIGLLRVQLGPLIFSPLNENEMRNKLQEALSSAMWLIRKCITLRVIISSLDSKTSLFAKAGDSNSENAILLTGNWDQKIREDKPSIEARVLALRESDLVYTVTSKFVDKLFDAQYQMRKFRDTPPKTLGSNLEMKVPCYNSNVLRNISSIIGSCSQ